MSSCYVSNISPQLSENHLRELFGCCGPIASLTLTATEPRTCHIVFTDESHAKAAFFLSGTPLGDRPLNVSLTPSAGPSPGGVQAGAGPPGIDPKLLAASLKRDEDVARTIYVGNLNLGIDENALKQFFSSVGTVTATKLAGDSDGKTTRFAFVEFADAAMARGALALSGTVLGDKAIKVGNAINPIVKAEEPKKDISAIMQKVLAHTQKISGKANRSRSRSRSRDRSRSRRSRRSRSRDRGRDRDRRDRDRSSSQQHHMNRRSRRSRSRSRDRIRRESRPAVPPPKKKEKVDRTGFFFDGAMDKCASVGIIRVAGQRSADRPRRDA